MGPYRATDESIRAVCLRCYAASRLPDRGCVRCGSALVPAAHPDVRPTLRDAVEGIASDMFDRMTVVKGRVIRIFTKHVQRSPPPPAERIATGAEPDADNPASLRLIVETRPSSRAP